MDVFAGRHGRGQRSGPGPARRLGGLDGRRRQAARPHLSMQPEDATPECEAHDVFLGCVWATSMDQRQEYPSKIASTERVTSVQK